MSHSVTKTKLRHSPNRSSAFCLYSSRYLSLRENSLLLRLASSVSSLVLQWSDNLWGIRTPPLWTDFLTRQALQIVYSAVLHSCYIKVKIRSTYSNVCWSPWNLGKALLTGIRPLLFCPKTKQNNKKKKICFVFMKTANIWCLPVCLESSLPLLLFYHESSTEPNWFHWHVSDKHLWYWSYQRHWILKKKKKSLTVLEHFDFFSVFDKVIHSSQVETGKYPLSYSVFTRSD